ncbi:MAG: hypothetical protein AAGH40_09150 [Verrucomicrobiota bacterium]
MKLLLIPFLMFVAAATASAHCGACGSGDEKHTHPEKKCCSDSGECCKKKKDCSDSCEESCSDKKKETACNCAESCTGEKKAETTAAPAAAPCCPSSGTKA